MHPSAATELLFQNLEPGICRLAAVAMAQLFTWMKNKGFFSLVVYLRRLPAELFCSGSRLSETGRPPLPPSVRTLCAPPLRLPGAIVVQEHALLSGSSRISPQPEPKSFCGWSRNNGRSSHPPWAMEPTLGRRAPPLSSAPLRTQRVIMFNFSLQLCTNYPSERMWERISKTLRDKFDSFSLIFFNDHIKASAFLSHQPHVP